MNRSRSAGGDGYRMLEGVAVAVTAMLVARALSAELEPLWAALRLLVRF